MWRLLMILLLSIGINSFAQNDSVKKDNFFEKIEKKREHDLNKERKTVINGDTAVFKLRWFIPDYFRYQYAGNIGFLSFGAGYYLGKHYELTFMYGMLNESFGDSPVSVNTFAVKNTFNLYNKLKYKDFTFVPTAGISVNWGYTNNTFKELPSYYSNGYYFQNKIHLAPFIGGKVQYKINKFRYDSIALYCELGTLDAYLLEFIRRDYITIDKILNLGFGVSIYFR